MSAGITCFEPLESTKPCLAAARCYAFLKDFTENGVVQLKLTQRGKV
jgi:hypothetical protein